MQVLSVGVSMYDARSLMLLHSQSLQRAFCGFAPLIFSQVFAGGETEHVMQKFVLF